MAGEDKILPFRGGCRGLSTTKTTTTTTITNFCKKMAYQTFQQEYMQIPPITRAYSTACVLTTIAVQLDIVTPFRLYFNPTLIFKHLQFWRLVTNFMFFGTVGK